MSTYTEVVDQIRSYTETDSTVLTTAIVNNFINQAELRIFREVDLDVFRAYQFATLAQGNEFVTLPGATPSTMSFVRTASIYPSTGTDANVRTYLIQKDISYMTEYWPNRTSTGIPKYYASWDNDTILVAPTPNAAYTMELAYNAQPTGLSSSNTTTWVSNNAPEMLLYACLVEAFKFLKNPQMVQMYESYYMQALQPFVGEQMGRRRRDEYMDGVPRIAIPSENP